MHAEEFKIHTFNGYIEELFLAEYPDKLLLLDGGARCDVEPIENFITQNLKRPMSDLKLIVSTHMHPDHAGAAPILRKKYGIPIATYFEADQWYRGIRGVIQHTIDIFMAYFVAIKSHKLKKDIRYPSKLKADIQLHDNASLPYFNDWTAIHAPGHTSHMIVLYQRERQILYAADMILRLSKLCILPFPINLRNSAAFTLQKIADLPIKTMLLAHGGVCENKNFREEILALIPTLFLKLPPPFNYFKFLSHFPKPIKEYLVKENNFDLS
jgi:glyoxylase-like metal-dependent hydrolase (beta-lactamase superfamily II)